MRSTRIRILTALLVLVAVGAGGRQLMPDRQEKNRTITVGTTDSVTSLDPAGAYDAGSWALFSNVYQSLLTYEPGAAAPVPDAASSCGFVGDGLLTYRCTLREGLRFAGGRAMTAEDVKFSFDRIRRINSPVGPAPLFATLDSVTTSGRTITFRLNSPDATFPFQLATGAGSLVDRNAYPADRLRTEPGADGSGPYLLSAYTAGERARLVPNPAYRGAVARTGRPVTLRYYPDSATLAEAWRARRVDVVTRELPPATIAALSPSDPDQRVTEADGAGIRALVLDVRPDSPLHDRRVRQALALHLDREKLADDIHRGTTDPLYSLVPAGITGHTPAFFDRYPEPDPLRARRLLDESGVPLPVRFTYGYAEGRGPAAEEAAELERQLEASGLFDVTTQGYEPSGFREQYTSGRLDAYGVNWDADYPDPDTYGGPLVGTGGSLRNGYSDSEVDRLIRSSRRHVDRSRAERDVRELQEAVALDVPLIPLWQQKEYVLSVADVGGGQYLSDGTGVLRLWRLDWI